MSENDEKVLTEDSISGSQISVLTDDNSSTTFENPDAHGIKENINEYQALMSFIKGNIGTGMLSMPIVLKYAGLWTGIGLMIVAACISTYMMHVLLRVTSAAQKRHNWDQSKMDYTEAVFVVLKFGPECLRKPKGKIKHTVNGFLIVTQIGLCCVYLLFISENTRLFLDSFFPNLHTNSYLVGFFVCLFLIPLCLISNMRMFSYLSAVANIFMLVGTILIFVYLFTSGFHPIMSFPAYTNFSGFVIAFSIVMFSFEGISLVLPIYSKMAYKVHYASKFGVLNMGMVIVFALNLGIGFYGYLRFGDDVRGSITLNVPEKPYWFAPVKPLFVVSITLSYLLQFYVPAVIFDRLMEKIRCHREASDRRRSIHQIAIRVFLVLFSYLIAITIPRLDLMISLIGSLAGSVLAFILPAWLEIVFLWPDRANIQWFWGKVFTKNVIVIVIGLLSFVVGTSTTIMQLVKAFSS